MKKPATHSPINIVNVNQPVLVPDHILQPGFSRGSSLHLHGHRRPLLIFLPHLLLL